MLPELGQSSEVKHLSGTFAALLDKGGAAQIIDYWPIFTGRLPRPTLKKT